MKKNNIVILLSLIFLLCDIYAFSIDVVQYIDIDSYGKGYLIYRFYSSRDVANALTDLFDTVGFKHRRVIYNKGEILGGIIFKDLRELNSIRKYMPSKSDAPLLPILPFLRTNFSLKRSGERNTISLEIPVDKRMKAASYIFDFHFDNVLKMEKVSMIDKQGNLFPLESIGKVEIMRSKKGIRYRISPSVFMDAKRLVFRITWLRKTSILSSIITITVIVFLLALWIWFSKRIRTRHG